jgi:hypothetical protein
MSSLYNDTLGGGQIIWPHEGSLNSTHIQPDTDVNMYLPLSIKNSKRSYKERHKFIFF